MRLIKFHCDGDEYFINPDKILYIYQSERVRINLVEDISIMVDESFKEVISRINNQEFNMSQDLFGEIERLKQKIKNLERTTAPA